MIRTLIIVLLLRNQPREPAVRRSNLNLAYRLGCSGINDLPPRTYFIGNEVLELPSLGIHSIYDR